MEKVERHPFNAEGDFYVEYEQCICCDAPRSEAPELMAYDEDMHCYFKRQPETAEELEHAIEAVRVSCVEAVLYGGDDPKIVERLRQFNHERYTDSNGSQVDQKPNMLKSFFEFIFAILKREIRSIKDYLYKRTSSTHHFRQRF